MKRAQKREAAKGPMEFKMSRGSRREQQKEAKGPVEKPDLRKPFDFEADV